jgi:hypothetical protein
MEKQEAERAGCLLQGVFLNSDNLWKGKDLVVPAGQIRVIDSYSVHALKLVLRYFNHMHGV